MKRRKFIVGAGSIVAGSAAAMGTGAFTSAQADRTLSVEVVGDANAYLALSEGPNTEIAEDIVINDGGEMKIALNGRNTKATGLNQDGITAFSDVLTATNQGASEVIFGVDTSALRSMSGIADFNVYAHHDSGSPEYDGQYFNTNGSYPASVSTPPGNGDQLVDLTTGEGVDLSFQVNTTDTKLDKDLKLPMIAVEKGGRWDDTQGQNF